MATEVLCPVLAEVHPVITIETIDSLSLSNYERSPGTSVKVTCLSKNTHILIGDSEVTCLDTGKWNSVPKCVQVDDVIWTGTTAAPQSGALVTRGLHASLPYYLTLGIVGAVVLTFVALLLYAVCRHRRHKQRENLESIFDGTKSSIRSQSELWVELANQRHFRCHEMARWHNRSRDSVCYNQPLSHWSARY